MIITKRTFLIFSFSLIWVLIGGYGFSQFERIEDEEIGWIPRQAEILDHKDKVDEYYGKLPRLL